MTILQYQNELSKTYGYKPLPEKTKWTVRRLYVSHLPAPFFDTMFDGLEGYPLFSKAGNCISRGFSRVVVGDYGAFVEIPEAMVFGKGIEILRGTEKRLGFQNAKYLWMCPVFPDGVQDTECKIYKQLKPVSYADYKEGMFYVSPFHLQYVQDDALPSEVEVKEAISSLKDLELERVGTEQLSMF